MRNVRHRAVYGVILASGLFLSACAGAATLSDDGVMHDDVNATYTGDRNPDGQTTLSEMPEPEWDVGPLDEFWFRITGFAWDDDGAAVQEREAQAHQVMEERIAACMAEQGFTYLPRDYQWGFITSGGSLPGAQVEPTAMWGTREWAETYGFGISTDPHGFLLEGALEHSEPDDPNQANLDAMSDAEYLAWNEALTGPSVVIIDEGGWSVFDAGCWGSAARERWEIQAPQHFLALENEIELFRWHTLRSDQRMVELGQLWSNCLTNAGFLGHADFRSPGDPLRAQWVDLLSALPEWATWDWEADPRGPFLDPATHAAFTEREQATAIADWECRENLGFLNRLRDAEFELQAEFVDRHWAELEAWAQYEESRRVN